MRIARVLNWLGVLKIDCFFDFLELFLKILLAIHEHRIKIKKMF